MADEFPPYWIQQGATHAVHHAPTDWPTGPASGNPADCRGETQCGDWIPYSRFQNELADPRVQDPSNGGTSPQNYVNIASSCIDKTLPSIYYALHQGADPNGADDVLFFRWRVEQVANTYATGPNTGAFRTTDPWNSALWTVLFDTDGDGVRDMAAHLDGSSGGPSEEIDRIFGIWGNIPTQSIDYNDDPDNIKLLGHNPTGFVDHVTDRLMNFHNSNAPDADWSSVHNDGVWDYGTSRATLVSTQSCTEYFIDYQIPVAMLNAEAFNGPKITRNTPLSMLFCTANSLNNPFQKDCALNKDWISNPLEPAPFGDYVTFDKGLIPQPIISSVSADLGAICGTYDLQARVQDTLGLENNSAAASVQAVEFLYYYDANANGQVDDGNQWTQAANGSLMAGSLNNWTGQWDARNLLKGQYLIGVQALDDNTVLDDDMTPSGIDNRTFSYVPEDSADRDSQDRIYLNDATGWYIDQADFPSHASGITPVMGENWYSNPDVTGNQIAVVGVALNVCGKAPTLAKSADTVQPGPGDTVTFTLTLDNAGTGTTITLSEISDPLPTGFTYLATTGGSLQPSASGPAVTGVPATGQTLTWGFSNLVIAEDSQATLIFTATAPTTPGTYNNQGRAETDFGTLDSPPVALEVGAPRLSIGKSVTTPDGSRSVSPGDALTYTITYSNDSAVSVTGATIVDTLPAGLATPTNFGSATWNAGSRTLTWGPFDLAAGAGPLTVSYDTEVNSPYDGAVPLVNSTVISANETTPPNPEASVSLFVDAPVPNLVIEKSANPAIVVPDPEDDDSNDEVTFTIAYANNGTGTASDVTISDTIPAGFTLVNASTGPDSVDTSGNPVVWTLGNVPADTSGSVTLTLKVDVNYSGPNPSTNTATITRDSSSASPTSSSADADVGIRQSGSEQVCTTYYMTGDVYNMSLADEYLATTAQPASANLVTKTVHDNTPATLLVSFYQDPAAAGSIDFASDTLTTDLFLTKSSNGRKLGIRIDIYDYDPGSGQKSDGLGNIGTPLITASYTDNGAQETPYTLPKSGETLSGKLIKGHRLLWEVWVHDASSNNGSMDITFQVGNSSSELCSSPPANLVIDKQVDNTIAQAGDSLSYTIRFANTGATDATNSTLLDTLPDGFTCSTVSGDGTPLSCPVGDTLTIAVNSNEMMPTPGTIVAGGSGEIVITGSVNDPLDAGITELLNTASISSDETPTVQDSATTGIQGAGGGGGGGGGSPNLVLSKTADKTALRPGDTVTYSLTVLNAGDGDSMAITVEDSLPGVPLSYVADSTKLNGIVVNPDPVAASSLSLNISTLAPGAQATISYQMLAGSSSGIVELDNSATITEDGNTSSPETVTVAVNANPILTLDKTATPTTGLKPGDTVEYTLTAGNTGNGTLEDLVITDVIPDNASFSGFVSGTSGTFDAINNRVILTQASLAAGNQQAFKFTVVLNSSLPDGSTLVDNQAQASAGNAPGVDDQVTVSASAAAVLEISKSAPAQLAFPAANLATAASNATVILVDNAATLSIGQYIRLNGVNAKITAIAGNQLTLAQPVSGSSGDPLAAGISYAISYKNTGDAPAIGAEVEDSLPAGVVFVEASDGVTPSGSTLTWSSLDINPGEGGTLQVVLIPETTGSLTNSATINLGGSEQDNDAANTIVGGLRVDKVTDTPVASAPGTAVYRLQVSNSLNTVVSNVLVQDQLPTGFSYASTDAVSGDLSAADTLPAANATEPTWVFNSFPALGTVEIEFTANISNQTGPATYQNPASITGTGVAGTAFDPLTTTREDVTVLADGTGLLEGYVYKDINDNGQYDPGTDTPFGGVTLDVNGGTYTPYTNTDGYFQQVVPAGNHNLKVRDNTLPVARSSLELTFNATDPSAINVVSGAAARNDTGYVDAGQARGTVTGHVFEDLNGNGVQEGGEPDFSGVTITIDTATGGTISLQTDGNGNYSASIPPGSTRLRATAPGGHSLSTAGEDDQTVNVSDGNSTASNPVGYWMPVANVFDPPNATKTVNAQGLPEVEWRMVWINNGNATALMVRVVDDIPAGTSYVPGSLDCSTPVGSTSTIDRCEEPTPGNDFVLYQGDIAPDPGAATEGDAANEVIIVFRTTLDSGVNQVENQASGYWDEDGDDGIDDQVGAGQQPVRTDDPASGGQSDPTRISREPTTTIPTVPPLGLWLMVVTLAWLAITRQQQRD